MGAGERLHALDSLRAVAMLLLRHPMRVAMSLVFTMISLGGIYGLLLGFGKDALARKYVSLASERHVSSLDLSALFAGVE